MKETQIVILLFLPVCILKIIVFIAPTKNYDGVEFATVLAAKFDEAVATFSPRPVLSASYDLLQNVLVVSLRDGRSG